LQRLAKRNGLYPAQLKEMNHFAEKFAVLSTVFQG
jgi:hypothetical protein